MLTIGKKLPRDWFSIAPAGYSLLGIGESLAQAGAQQNLEEPHNQKSKFSTFGKGNLERSGLLERRG